MVFAQKHGAAQQKIGVPIGRQIPTAVVPHPCLRDQQNLPGSAPDLRRQIGVTAKLAVPLIDLSNGFNDELAHHQRCAARIFNR